MADTGFAPVLPLPPLLIAFGNEKLRPITPEDSAILRKQVVKKTSVAVAVRAASRQHAFADMLAEHLNQIPGVLCARAFCYGSYWSVSAKIGFAGQHPVAPIHDLYIEDGENSFHVNASSERDDQYGDDDGRDYYPKQLSAIFEIAHMLTRLQSVRTEFGL